MPIHPQFTNPPQSGAPEVLNQSFETVEHVAIYGKRYAFTAGLVWAYYGSDSGTGDASVRWGGFDVPEGTFTLANNADNYLVVEIATGTPTASTSSTNWDDDTNYARTYKVTTLSGAVSAVEDHRNGPGGIGGGSGGGGGSSVSAWKEPVRAASTATGTLATAYENGDSLDGVTLATGDRILLKDQGTGAENGIYTVNASGAPTRAADADAGSELVGATVFVSEGSTNGNKTFTCTNNAPISLGSDALVFAAPSAGVYQPLDTDLTDIAALSPTNDDLMQRKAGAWTNRTPAQVAVDLQGTGASSSAVGFRGLPVNAQTGNYTAVLSDMAKVIRHSFGAGAGDTFTIDSSGTVAWPDGAPITFENRDSSSVDIAVASDTLRWADDGSTGTRALAQYGVATALFDDSINEWLISGTGLS